MRKIELKDFTSKLDINGDLVPAMKRFLEESSEGNWNLKLDNNLNFIYPEQGEDRLAFISNNDSGIVRPALNLVGLKNIEIDGCGTKLVVRGIPQVGRGAVNMIYSPVIPFILENCENVTLKNFSIDWATPFIMEGTVRESKAGEIKVEMQTTQRWWTWNGMLYLEGEGWTHNIQRLLAADPETGAIANNTGDNFGAGYEMNWHYDTSEDGKLIIKGDYDNMPEVGKLIFFWAAGYNTTGRRSPSIFIDKCKNVRIENVTIHHSWGMGLIAQRSENLDLENLTIEPSENRHFSLTADATHFVSCKGDININNCRFQNMFDDGINNHGIFLKILRKISENTLLIRVGHPQHIGLELMSPEDQIEILSKETLEVIDSAKVIEVRKINNEVSEIILDKDVICSESDVIENVTWYPNMNITNCTTRWNRARGFLLNGRGNLLVDGCTFENSGTAVMVETSAEWCESGPVKNLTIKNSKFVNCAHTNMWGDSIIKVTVDLLKPENRKTPIHSGIRLENNSVIDSKAPLFKGDFVEDIIMENND